MTSLSRFALSASLAFGALAMTGAPAVAQKKKEEKAAAVKADFSPAFRKAAAPAEAAHKLVAAANQKVNSLRGAGPSAALTAAEAEAKTQAAAAAGPIAAAEAAATNPDDKYLLNSWKIDLAVANGDNAGVSRAFGAMLDTNSSLIQNRSAMLAKAGAIAYQAKNYDEAVARFTAAEGAGTLDAQSEIFFADALFKRGDRPNGFIHAKKAIEKSQASGTPADASWYRMARQEAMKASLIKETGEWSRMLARAHPSPETWHDGIAHQINTAKLADEQRVEMFRLMLASGAMIDAREYRELVDLLIRLKLPGEAGSVLDAGVQSGKLKENDAKVAEYRSVLKPMIAADRSALAGADRSRSAANGRPASNWGTVFLGYRDYPKAIDYLQLALTKGGIDADETNLRLGQALLASGRKADAIAAFDKVTGPTREIAQFWRFYAETKA